MKRLLAGLALATAPVALGLGVSTASAATPDSTSAGSSTGLVSFVQALPDRSVTMTVDGKQMDADVASGKVSGPFSLSPGSHEVVFTGGQALHVTTSVDVKAGGNTDLVLHLPAAVDGAPTVNTYATPTKPIGPGKSRVLVAHTATVGAADIAMDGTTVFTDVSNGQFADADVPAGEHKVAVFATGSTTDPVLGPLPVDLSAGTVTMAYAYGNPADKSMKIVAHAARLASDGSVTPTSVHTGTAGLAGPTTAFGAPSLGGLSPAVPVLAALALLLGFLALRARRATAKVPVRGRHSIERTTQRPPRP